MINLNQKLIKDIKKENEKTFYKKIDKIVHSLIGHKLITFTVIDEKLKFCERVYSNNNKIYPILGQKKMPKNIWSTKVLKNKQHFICKSIYYIIIPSIFCLLQGHLLSSNCE